MWFEDWRPLSSPFAGCVVMPQSFRDLLPLIWIVAVVGAVVGSVVAASRSTLPSHHWEVEPPSQVTRELAARIDAVINVQISAAGLEPAALAEDVLVLRRMWLALAGTVPSVEELRRFEADSRPDRL